MLDFARKTMSERFALFKEASERLDIGPHIIEKDWKSLLRCIRFAPVWMQPVLKAIAENKKVGSYGFRRRRRNGGLEHDDIATN